MNWEADVQLAEHTRYRIGGPATFGRATDRSDLASALRDLEGIAPRVLGWGANLLVHDAGVPEPVVVLGEGFGGLEVDERRIRAGAAAGLPALVGEARRAGRTGWSFLEAVPGSVGGGLRMNAGSAEIGLWERVVHVEAMLPDGRIERLDPESAEPGYRRTSVPAEWIFVAAEFEALPGDPSAVDAGHFERRKAKVESQVYDLPSCGSIWTNPGPPHGSAWELVERVGMRGARKGGAQITERHANFIANIGGATAVDVWWLMAETRRRVFDETGVRLEPEIRLWGFDAAEREAVGAPADEVLP